MPEETEMPLQTEIPTEMVTAPPESYLVVGYLPSYATSKKHGYDIAKAPGDQLTHLIYGFAGLEFEQQGNVWQPKLPEPMDETKNFKKLLALKQSYPSLKLMLSIGGWNNSQEKVNDATIFSTIAADSGLRQAFAQSCLPRFSRE